MESLSPSSPYKGCPHAKDFQNACKRAIEQQALLTTKLVKLKSEYPAVVTDEAFPSSTDKRLLKIFDNLLTHKWKDALARAKKNALIPAVSKYVSAVKAALDEEQKNQDLARQARERLAALKKQKQDAKAAQEAEQKEEECLEEIREMGKVLDEFYDIQKKEATVPPLMPFRQGRPSSKNWSGTSDKMSDMVEYLSDYAKECELVTEFWRSLNGVIRIFPVPDG